MSAPLQTTDAVTLPAKKKFTSMNFLGTLWENRNARVGLVLLGFFLVIALLAPLITPYDPNAANFMMMQSPSWQHLMGTTQTGQDVFSQLIAGTGNSLAITFGIGLIATAGSLIVGLLAGYAGGWVDGLLNFMTNVFLVIPGLPLLIVISSYLPGGGTGLIIFIIGITSWPWGARVLRSQVLSLRNRDYVLSARLAGESTFRILFAEIMPNMAALVVAQFLGSSTYGLLAAAGLQFLGLGDPNQLSWGTMLYWSQNSSALLQGQWAWIAAPGLCIALLGTALTLINFGFDAISNPRLREQS